MSKNYQVYEHGDLNAWGSYTDGLSPQSAASGRSFIDKNMPLEYFGVSLNSRNPGEGADYRHAHSITEYMGMSAASPPMVSGARRPSQFIVTTH